MRGCCTTCCRHDPRSSTVLHHGPTVVPMPIIDADETAHDLFMVAGTESEEEIEWEVAGPCLAPAVLPSLMDVRCMDEAGYEHLPRGGRQALPSSSIMGRQKAADLREGSRGRRKDAAAAASPEHFAALEALRCVAALGVSVLHLERGDFFLHGLSGSWAPALYLGLDFFLVLSGFVLCKRHVLAERPLKPHHFVLQRFLRLWPLHAFAVASTALARLANGALNLEPLPWALLDFAQEVFLLHCVGLPYPHVAYNNMLSWTVSCEFWTNALFASLPPCADPASLVLLLLLSFCLQVCLFLQSSCLDVWTGAVAGVFGLGMMRCGSCFVLGLVSSVAHKHCSSLALGDLAASGLEAALAAAVAALVFLRPEHCFASDYAAPWLFCLVVAVFAREEGRLSQGLASVGHAGRVSYSVYLNQWTVLFALKASGVLSWQLIQGSLALQVLLYWGALIPYSCMTYCLVERPVLRWWEVHLRPKLQKGPQITVRTDPFSSPCIFEI